MVNILSVAYFIWLALLGSGSANGSCRKCHGTYQFQFEKALNRAQAKLYLKHELAGCTADGLYTITGLNARKCFRGLCRSYTFFLDVDRYCGKIAFEKYGEGTSCKQQKYPLSCWNMALVNFHCGEAVSCPALCNCTASYSPFDFLIFNATSIVHAKHLYAFY